MPLDLRGVKRHAKEYIELEAHTTVTKVTFVKRFELFGREDILLSVETTDRKFPKWWVIGGSSPMNLYSQKDFPEPNVAYSLHIGLTLRISDRQFKESRTAPKEIGYDAFISHASEDKEKIVKPLARALSSRGFRIWYDEFALKVGDSLRQSIDKGLATSEYGIVVLSPSFFAKHWPQYELNGLTAREIDGRKVILPVWFDIDKKEILKFSPHLADRVALDAKRMSLRKIADTLADVLRSDA